MDNQANVRRFCPEDYVRVSEIDRECFEYSYSGDAFRTLMASRGYVTPVKGQVQGFVLADFSKPQIEIQILGVAKGRRRAGHGRNLLRFFQSLVEGDSSEYNQIHLKCDENNDDAIRFYSDIGFKRTALIHQAYMEFHPPRNAIVWSYKPCATPAG